MLNTKTNKLTTINRNMSGLQDPVKQRLSLNYSIPPATLAGTPTSSMNEKCQYPFYWSKVTCLCPRVGCLYVKSDMPMSEGRLPICQK